MAGRRVIGLDVGTNAVRVADVEFNDTITLRAFGQVALPLHAVREGEVLDPGAVTAAIQRLWRELGLKKGEVRVGIGGPRVIVRTVDLPAMPDADLASAIRFQAQELIPIPLDDAVLDFQVLEALPGPDGAALGMPGESGFTEPPPDPATGVVSPADGGGGLPPVPGGGATPGAPASAATVASPTTTGTPVSPTEDPTLATPGVGGTNRVMVAAAHREAVGRLVGAVRAAGLKVGAVDLAPLALVRALGRRVGSDGPGAEGIVSIGGGVTTIVVHEAGLPRFVRMLGTGGRALTEAIARDLDLTVETAEALKRQGADSPPELAPRVQAALERPLGDLVEEVRGSLDYWRTQPGAVRLVRVTVTGGVSLQPGVTEGLTRVLGVPVERARPRDGLEVGDIGFPPDEVGILDPYLPVPIGLALGGAVGARRINLVSGEKASSPQDTRKLALVIAAVAAGLLLLLGFLTYRERSELSDAKDDLAAQQATNTQLQTKINALSEAQADQAKIEAIQGQVATVLQTDVSWSSMLQEIARTIPDDTWLTAFQGAVTADATGAASSSASTAAGISGSTSAPTGSTGTTPTTPTGGISGTVSFTATGLDFTSISSWIKRVGEIPSYSNLWVPSATAAQLGGRTVVNFTSNAALTDKAKSNRQQTFTQQDQTGTGGAP